MKKNHVLKYILWLLWWSTIFVVIIDGFYLYSNPSILLNDGKSTLETGQLKSTTSGQCLKFWYNINGKTPGTFNVKLLLNNTEFVLFTKSETLGESIFYFRNIIFCLKIEKKNKILCLIRRYDMDWGLSYNTRRCHIQNTIRVYIRQLVFE